MSEPSNEPLGSPSPARRKQLKKAAKEELERRFHAFNDALNEAVPLHSGNDPTWAKRFKLGVERKRWLRKALPLLRKAALDKHFVVVVDTQPLSAIVGGYMRCTRCGSVAPTALPATKRIYWKSCGCGNIRWRKFFKWGGCRVQDPRSLEPVRLLGRGQ